MRRTCSRALQKCDTVHLGHHVVGDDDAGTERFDEAESFVRLQVAACLVTGATQRAIEGFEGERVIVNNDDRARAPIGLKSA